MIFLLCGSLWFKCQHFTVRGYLVLCMCHLPTTLMRALTSISEENNQWWPQNQTQLTHNKTWSHHRYNTQALLPRIPLQSMVKHGKTTDSWPWIPEIWSPLSREFSAKSSPACTDAHSLPGWHSHTGWLFPAVFCFQFRSVSFPNPLHAEIKGEQFNCWVF